MEFKARLDALIAEIRDGDLAALEKVGIDLALLHPPSPYELPLIEAFVRPEAIPVLARLGADLDRENDAGSTPLEMAVYLGNAVAFDALLKAGADINADIRTDRHSTALLIAVEVADASWVERIMAAAPDIRRQPTPPLAAAALYKRENVDALLAAGIGVDELSSGQTALCDVAQHGIELVDYFDAFESAGLPFAEVPPDPVQTAAAEQSTTRADDAVALLLKKGADPERKNAYGWTPRMIGSLFAPSPASTRLGCDKDSPAVRLAIALQNDDLAAVNDVFPTVELECDYLGQSWSSHARSDKAVRWLAEAGVDVSSALKGLESV